MGRSGPVLVNLLTGVALLLTFCIGAAFLAVFIAPEISPFPPPTLPAVAVLPTATDTPIPSATPAFPTLPPTVTPTPSRTPAGSGPTQTGQPTATFTRGPTDTASPTATDTLDPNITPSPSNTLDPNVTPSPSPTATNTLSPFPFTLQVTGIQYTSQFAHPTSGCNWMGIGGQVFDLSGNPIVGYLVHLDGGGLSLDAFTGSRPEYGSSGFEFVLDTTPRQTTGEYNVQLRDPSGAALSDRIAVDTKADCGKNLALVNFVQNH